ncbi:hypothetical protein CSOJ01_07468 [Colletotrichum sojae]|uniref:Uncharacterized protein n=1 Tax=Colletotrichum sojae TaxID=2175907 RepID=A0A8H6MTK3_9PEZI|nr:hypothetical protein CSOJ01_07468 [Colletotrichum sojae]
MQLSLSVVATLMGIQAAYALPTDGKTPRVPDAIIEARCDCGWNLCCNPDDNCSISMDYCLENCPIGDGGVSCIISCASWCG